MRMRHFSALGPRSKTYAASLVRTCNFPAPASIFLIEVKGIFRRTSPRKMISSVSRRALPRYDFPSARTEQASSCPISDAPSIRIWAVKSESIFLLIEKRVGSALSANGGDFAVARIDERIVGKLENFLGQGLHDFFEGTAPQIGAADASSEEGVTREQLRLAELDLAGFLGEE